MYIIKQEKVPVVRGRLGFYGNVPSDRGSFDENVMLQARQTFQKPEADGVWMFLTSTSQLCAYGLIFSGRTKVVVISG